MSPDLFLDITVGSSAEIGQWSTVIQSCGCQHENARLHLPYKNTDLAYASTLTDYYGKYACVISILLQCALQLFSTVKKALTVSQTRVVRFQHDPCLWLGSPPSFIYSVTASFPRNLYTSSVNVNSHQSFRDQNRTSSTVPETRPPYPALNALPSIETFRPWKVLH